MANMEKANLTREKRLLAKDVSTAVRLIIEGISPYLKTPLLKYSKKKSVSSKHSRFLVLRIEGMMVGFLMYRMENFTCYIYEIHMDSEYRGKQGGQRLFDELFSLMAGCVICLFVHKENTRAMKFYCKNGFVLDPEFESGIYYKMKKMV